MERKKEIAKIKGLFCSKHEVITKIIITVEGIQSHYSYEFDIVTISRKLGFSSKQPYLTHDKMFNWTKINLLVMQQFIYEGDLLNMQDIFVPIY